jgi:hypothetical protein
MTVIANFAAGTLTVTLDTAGDTATINGNSTQGTGIDVTGSGLSPAATFTGVNNIVVQDTGTNATQSVTFTNTTGRRINLPGSLSVAGIETVTFGNTLTLGAQSVDIATVTNGLISFRSGVASDTITTPGTQSYGNAITMLAPVNLTAA